MHRAVPGAERPWISHQLTAVCGLYLPTSHAAHVPALAFPQPERYVPASQGVHVLEPASEYEPAAHTSLTPPPGHEWPAGQAVHSVLVAPLRR